MRINKVELHPAGSSSVCVLTFKDPSRQSPYNVKAIHGIDADEIVPGKNKLEKRDLIIRIVPNPDATENETYSSLRDQLYRLIASSRTGILQVQLKLENTVVAVISGSVIKFEASHFEQQPEVQITISCPDPMFRSIDPVELDVSELNPALTTIQDDTSTAPHGLKFRLAVGAALASFDIRDPDDDSWSFVVSPIGGFLEDDVINFSSEDGNKYIYVERDAEIIHMADAIVSGSSWPVIFPGENNFTVEDAASLDWLSIEHRLTYWGV